MTVSVDIETVIERPPAEVFAALDTWERHTDLAVVPD